MQVGYEAGSGGRRLPDPCMRDLDAELIPVIHRAAANITQEPIILELLFHILEQWPSSLRLSVSLQAYSQRFITEGFGDIC